VLIASAAEGWFGKIANLFLQCTNCKCCRGLVHYTDLLALLRQIDPPLGFGSKCPDLLAYKRLVRMNMPVDEEGKVSSVV
jgi:hypothetical protein